MTVEDRINSFTELCEKMSFQIYDNFLDWLKNNQFFTAPASTKYHGAYEGGLFDHSLCVAKRLVKLSIDNKLEWQRKESPFIIGIFHDLCKCDQYKKIKGTQLPGTDMFIDEGFHYEYNANTLLKGHGAKSIMLLSQFITLTEEEMLCIRYHMGAYEKEEWAEFDNAIRKYENVLWTHTADMLASKVDDV
jgi:HD superfamily phosphohydrolase YqeK